MKAKLILALLALAILAALVWNYLPKNPGRSGGGLPDPDSAAYAKLERQRLAFDSAWQADLVRDAATKRAYDDSLAAARNAALIASRQTMRYRAKADSLARALAKERDDDDSLPMLVQLVAAKDSVIVGLEGEVDAARGMVIVLERALESRDTAITVLTRAIREAVRQRDSYRRFTQRCRFQATAGATAVVAGGIHTGPGITAGFGCRV